MVFRAASNDPVRPRMRSCVSRRPSMETETWRIPASAIRRATSAETPNPPVVMEQTMPAFVMALTSPSQSARRYASPPMSATSLMPVAAS